MKKTNIFTLEAFKEAIKNDDDLKSDIIGKQDIIEEARFVVYRCNLPKYLEKYLCKDEDDLSDTLYYRYGIFLKVID